MKVVYSARYHIDIGPHVFPTRKYRPGSRPPRRDRRDPGRQTSSSRSPRAGTMLARVHTAEYLAKMRDGTLSADDLAQLELPWSAGMVEVSVMVGGTIQAARIACGLTMRRAREASRELGPLRCRVSYRRRTSPRVPESRRRLLSVQRCRGRGARSPGARHRARRDRRSRRPPRQRHGVHLSDGSDPRTPVFTFSMHQQHNYPMWKPRGLARHRPARRRTAMRRFCASWSRRCRW